MGSFCNCRGLTLLFVDRSFDEPSFGSFDNNDDADSIWGFNPVNTKVSLSKVLARHIGDSEIVGTVTLIYLFF